MNVISVCLSVWFGYPTITQEPSNRFVSIFIVEQGKPWRLNSEIIILKYSSKKTISSRNFKLLLQNKIFFTPKPQI